MKHLTLTTLLLALAAPLSAHTTALPHSHAAGNEATGTLALIALAALAGLTAWRLTRKT